MQDTNPQSDETAPDIAKILGWGGVAPFILCGAAAQSGERVLVLYGVLGGTTYAAVILSFLGAVHWGLAMRDNRHHGWYIWSIIPSLLAWATLMVFDIQIRLLVLIPLFTLAWAIDRIASKQGLIPAWYMQLRTGLTIGAVVGLILMGV